MTDYAAGDTIGFITAPLELIHERVKCYVDDGHDRAAMGMTVAYVLSDLVWLTLAAQLTNQPCIQIRDFSLTLDEAHARIEGLRALPCF